MNYKYIFIIPFLISSFVWASDVALTTGPISCQYKKKDLKEDYNVESDVIINCDSSSCTVKGNGVNVSAGLVNITSAGTYILRGVLEGQVVIDATEDEHVQLVLDDTSIFSQSGPAIYGVSADKITLTIVGNNTIADSPNYIVNDKNQPDACLFIDSDLSINGSGTLSVMGRYNDAIRCKKDLKLIDATINVPNALGKGIRSKNSICIKDANISINSVDTGIKVTRENSPIKGYIVIDNGDIAIKTGKDGIHARSHLTINEGIIDIKESLEGMEAQMIDILGGEIHITAANDGINASKMNNNHSSSNDGSVYINIVGGKIYINVYGNDCDGLDSNGILYIGGEAEVYTSINGGNIYGNKSALESAGANSIVKGATVIATASNSDDANVNNNDNTSGTQKHNGSIYQPYIYTSVANQGAGTEILVKDNNSQIIASYTPEVNFQKIFITSPKLILGKTYTLIIGKSAVQMVFASEGHSGSIDSPSISSPAERNVSSFEEVVVLDKVYDVNDVNDTTETNVLDKDEDTFKDFVDNNNKNDFENQFIQAIEDEIDDYYYSTKESSSSNTKSNTNDNAATKSSSINITNEQNDDDDDDDSITLPKYFHFDHTKENPYEVQNADNQNNNTSNSNTSTTKSSSIDTTNEQNDDDTITLPKYFHFDISRKGDKTENPQHKWKYYY